MSSKHRNRENPVKGGTQNNKTKDRASGIAPKKMYGRYLPLLEEVLSAK